MVVVIDGPAGSGKSATARRVAEILGYVLLDSGMLYRAVATAFVSAGVPCSESAAESLLDETTIEVHCSAGGMRVSINGADVTDQLRTEAVSTWASQVAKLSAVRTLLLDLQRSLARRYGNNPGLVAEGRDMGTVVFEDADLKYFFTASAAVRAHRRHAEHVALGTPSNYDAILTAIQDRDVQDSQRRIAPLKRAPDAIEVDTDGLSLDDQVNLVLGHVRERQGKVAG